MRYIVQLPKRTSVRYPHEPFLGGGLPMGTQTSMFCGSPPPSSSTGIISRAMMSLSDAGVFSIRTILYMAGRSFTLMVGGCPSVRAYCSAASSLSGNTLMFASPAFLRLMNHRLMVHAIYAKVD